MEIVQALEKYKDIINKSKYDVFQSTKGFYLFAEYDEKHQEFLSITPFTTAEELKYLLICGVADNISCSIETTIEDATLNYKEVDLSVVSTVDDYKTMIPTLINSINGFKRAVQNCTDILNLLFSNIEIIMKD